MKSFLADGAWGRFLGFWECCCLAVFSYTGCELLGITADETARQRDNIPKAVKRVSHRIVVYYVSATFMLGLTVSANDPILTQTDSTIYHGAFVVMLQRAGIPGLPHLVNAVMIIAALSVATADVYVAVPISGIDLT
jgi:yeast amino acid transporter